MRIFLVDEDPAALTAAADRIRADHPDAEVLTFPRERDLTRWMTDHGTARIRVQTFGNFEVFWGERPLRFRRSRTKELFAYLIDRRGAGCTMGQLVSVLWEGRPDTPSLRSQLRSLITDLRSTFRDLGEDGVIVKERDLLAVDPGRVSCDYYAFLAGDPTARNGFRGEYMSNYSWGETTLGALQQKK